LSNSLVDINAPNSCFLFHRSSTKRYPGRIHRPQIVNASADHRKKLIHLYPRICHTHLHPNKAQRYPNNNNKDLKDNLPVRSNTYMVKQEWRLTT